MWRLDKPFIFKILWIHEGSPPATEVWFRCAPPHVASLINSVQDRWHKLLMKGDIIIKDRFGKPVQPREWFLVPLNVIQKVIERIQAKGLFRVYPEVIGEDLVEVRGPAFEVLGSFEEVFGGDGEEFGFVLGAVGAQDSPEGFVLEAREVLAHDAGPFGVVAALLELGGSVEEVVDDVEHVGKFVNCDRSEEHTSELQSSPHLVCRLLLE